MAEKVLRRKERLYRCIPNQCCIHILVDKIVAMNNKSRECWDAQAFEYNAIYVSLDKITQNTAVRLQENQLVFMFQSSDLSHILVVIQSKIKQGLKGKANVKIILSILTTF